MFNVTVQNVTGTRKDTFTADSLSASKKRASEILRSGIIHYSNALIAAPDGDRYSGHVSVGGNRLVWRQITA